MAAPAEVSKRRSNFRKRQFKEKHHFNIATNLTLNTMASFFILLIAHTARIACADRHTYIQTRTHARTHAHTHTHTRDNYCNPCCACAPMVNTGRHNTVGDLLYQYLKKASVFMSTSILVKNKSMWCCV